MKVKFKNGYTVEIDDAYLKNTPKCEIIKKAKTIVDEMACDEDNVPMVIIKKIKTPNGFKVVVIKNNTVSGIKRFDKNNEYEAQDFYDRLADKYNLDEEGYEDYGNTRIAAPAQYFKMQMQDSVARKSKKVKDAPIAFSEELGFAVTPTTINRLISKKNGHALDPKALAKALHYLETDLDYDINVKGPKWADPDNMVTDPRMVNKIMKRYNEFVAELDKIDDEAFNDKAQEIIDKVDVLKQIVYGIDDTGPDVSSEEDVESVKTVEEETPVIEEPVKEVVKEKVVKKAAPKTAKPVEKVETKVEVKPVEKEIPTADPNINYADDEEEVDWEDSVDDACHDSDCEDVFIEDVPVAGATVHASVEGAPDHSFNKTILVRGNSRALSEDETDAEYGRRLLMGEYEDVKETLLYDIAHAGEVAAVTPKYLLHMGMEKYKEIVDLYNVPGLEREYAELVRLYNKLFYNGYYLGVRGN